MRNWKFILFTLIVITSLIGITACGGGGSDTPEIPGVAGDYLEVDYNFTMGSVQIGPNAGSTSATVTHGLGGTPTSVVVLPYTTPGYQLYDGYNINEGVVGISASGTADVTHGLAGTPTAVILTYALAQSGSAVVVSAPKSNFGLTTFRINAYTVTTDGEVSAASSGSVSWVAYCDDALRAEVTSVGPTTFTVQKPGYATGTMNYYYMATVE